MMGSLYLVGVPIGNYDDFTFRGLRILKEVALILCEDTRETKKLLDNFLIKNRLLSYVASEKGCFECALSLLRQGKDVALVSDRGMPCVSDPGADFVLACRDFGVEVKVVPGVSAVTSAFAVTGLKGGFCFHGFLPKSKGDILKILKNLSDTNHIFFESPYRLKKTLSIIASEMPEKIVYVVREMTKTYEEVLVGKAQELLDKEIKGEIVLII